MKCIMFKHIGSISNKFGKFLISPDDFSILIQLFFPFTISFSDNHFLENTIYIDCSISFSNYGLFLHIRITLNHSKCIFNIHLILFLFNIYSSIFLRFFGCNNFHHSHYSKYTLIIGLFNLHTFSLYVIKSVFQNTQTFLFDQF